MDSEQENGVRRGQGVAGDALQQRRHRGPRLAPARPVIRPVHGGLVVLGGRSHPKVRAGLLLRNDLLSDAPGGMGSRLTALLGSYRQSLSDLESHTDKVGSAVKSQVREFTDRLLDLSSAAQTAFDRLQSGVGEVRVWIAGQAAGRAADRKKLSNKMAKYLRDFGKGGTPAVLARALVSAGVFPPPAGAEEFPDWPVYIERSCVLVRPGASEASLDRPDAWENPSCFDLNGDLPTGSVGAQKSLVGAFPRTQGQDFSVIHQLWTSHRPVSGRLVGPFYTIRDVVAEA